MRFLGVFAFLLLSGCGLKGDLYLPPPKPPAAEPAAAQPQPEGMGPREDAEDKDNATKSAPKPP